MEILELQVVRKEYAVDVNTEQFSRLLKREDKCEGLALVEELGKLNGVSNIEYDGHFGSAIYFRIDCDVDSFSLQKKVVKIIQKHLNRK